MRLQDIAIVTNTPLDTDTVLLEKFKSHDRIQWDPKTDLYSYRVGLANTTLGSTNASRSMNLAFAIKLLSSQKYSDRHAKAVGFQFVR